MDDDRYIPGFTKLTNAVHKHGCPIFLQIMHSGPWYVPDEGREVLGERVSSSALPEKEFRELAEMRAPDMIMPREPSVAEIEDLIDKFAKTAERAQKAGFDGVEINGSHHHLVNCFFSTIWNRRHDAYGCDNLENRARFACGIVAEVKRRCEGLLAEDPFRLLPWLSQKGAIMLPGAAYERINDEGLVVKTKEGERLTLKADSIITALPLDPAPEAWKLPEEVKADVYRIGDCREPGFMHNAISDGFRVGIMI